MVSTVAQRSQKLEPSVSGAEYLSTIQLAALDRFSVAAREGSSDMEVRDLERFVISVGGPRGSGSLLVYSCIVGHR